MTDPRIQSMARTLIRYSTKVRPGELVLLRGTSPAAMPLMQALTEEALKVGGKPFNYVHMSQEDRIMAQYGTPEQAGEINPMLKLMYDTADVIIRIEADDDTGQLAGQPKDNVQARMRAKGGILNIQMAREAARTLRRCTTLLPTPSYASDAGMSLAEYEDFVYQACMVHLEDPVSYWEAMHAEQEKLVQYLKGRKHLQVRGKNIDMEMSIEGRTFENASGLFNFPDGEIFTGPVEESVNGWVHFTFPAIYQGNRVEGARLRFKDGLIVEASADSGVEFLNAVLDTDPGARRLGEFAIGTNKGVDRFTGHILFDEKIHGTVHMAVGQSYASTGGKNASSIHWDLICDMRDGGEILIDGQRFYQNGAFFLA
jgi:aminopeptidase